MFKVVGQGIFTKEDLINKLIEWGIVNASWVVMEAEKKGRFEYGKHRILVFR
ncbi:hypothetical protein [Paenibacillus sp. NAIST15-1]|uniref:hypothetical protein n=1 Tax=Paenibacillus sp. NAIST15-1 TaxID=1605994 RepID=UPI000ABFC272|nr:hypothetical protein [Paenibacillus sp. NAIST15-1]